MMIRLRFYRLLDIMGSGRLHHARWMSKLGIPPVPAWTVNWFFDLKDWLSRRNR
jgi:hypothetical protein